MNQRTNQTVRAATESGLAPEPTAFRTPTPDDHNALLSPEEERFVEAFVAYWVRRGAEIGRRAA